MPAGCLFLITHFAPVPAGKEKVSLHSQKNKDKESGVGAFLAGTAKFILTTSRNSFWPNHEVLCTVASYTVPVLIGTDLSLAQLFEYQLGASQLYVNTAVGKSSFKKFPSV